MAQKRSHFTANSSSDYLLGKEDIWRTSSALPTPTKTSVIKPVPVPGIMMMQ